MQVTAGFALAFVAKGINKLWCGKLNAGFQYIVGSEVIYTRNQPQIVCRVNLKINAEVTAPFKVAVHYFAVIFAGGFVERYHKYRGLKQIGTGAKLRVDGFYAVI